MACEKTIFERLDDAELRYYFEEWANGTCSFHVIDSATCKQTGTYDEAMAYFEEMLAFTADRKSEDQP